MNDRREGAGVYTSQNGNKWSGEFKNDRPNGRGVLTDKAGKILKEGVWSTALSRGRLHRGRADRHAYAWRKWTGQGSQLAESLPS